MVQYLMLTNVNFGFGVFGHVEAHTVDLHQPCCLGYFIKAPGGSLGGGARQDSTSDGIMTSLASLERYLNGKSS